MLVKSKTGRTKTGSRKGMLSHKTRQIDEEQRVVVGRVSSTVQSIIDRLHCSGLPSLTGEVTSSTTKNLQTKKKSEPNPPPLPPSVFIPPPKPPRDSPSPHPPTRSPARLAAALAASICLVMFLKFRVAVPYATRARCAAATGAP